MAEALRQKYAPKFAQLEAQKQRAAAAAEKQKAQQHSAMLQSAVSVGSAILGAFLGRKAVSATTLNKAATAARQVGRTWKESQDVGIAEASAEQVAQLAVDLQKQFDADLAVQQSKIDPATETFDTVTVRPKKTNITVQLVALAWGD